MPFKNVNGDSLLNKMKLFRIKKIICNSLFTKKIIDKEYNVNSVVLYPPVDTNIFKPKRKEDTICYVGRFSDLVQNKGHEYLIKAFKKLVKDNKFLNWKLILAGGVEVGVGNYLDNLKKIAKGHNIEFVESPEINNILDIYGKSKFFWSAAGYGVDEEKNPEKLEHFGITLIEAMSAGAIPIVYNGGGYSEIIEDGKNGFLWDNLDGLIKFSKQVVNKSLELRRMSKNTQERSGMYSYEKFRKTITEII